MHKFPKIHQYRHAVQFANLRVSRKVTYEGTVKIHGANTSVVLAPDGTLKACQSRNTVLTADADFMAFHKWASNAAFQQVFTRIVANIKERQEITGDIVLFGEWCGPGVQKGTAINNAEHRMWWVFGGYTADDARIPILLAEDIPEALSVWHIHHVDKAGVTRVVVDFGSDETTEAAEARLNLLIDRVENQCPVGSYLGLDGIGEGMVFTPVEVDGKPVADDDTRNGLRFKLKGDKHKVMKPKKGRVLSAEDQGKAELAQTLAESVVTENRLEQGFQTLIETRIIAEGETLDSRHIGPMIKWITGDVEAEETDLILEHGVTVKNVRGPIAKIVRQWVVDNIGKEA